MRFYTSNLKHFYFAKRTYLPPIVVLLFLLFYEAAAFSSTFSKALPDTLLIHINDKATLLIAVEDIHQAQKLPGLNALLTLVNKDIEAIEDSLLNPAHPATLLYTIAQDGSRKLEVNPWPMERTGLYVSKETGQIKSRAHPDTLHIRQVNQPELFFIVESLSQLKSLQEKDLDGLFENFSKALSSELLSIKKRNLIAPLSPYTAIYQEKEPTLTMRYSGAKNSWGIAFMTGGGLIRDRLVPELGIGFSLLLSKKHYLGISATAHYFFERGKDTKSYQMHINTFLTAEYGIRITRELWQTIGIGYLLSEQGGYLSKHTVKISLGLNRRRMKGLHLIPELYITDGFSAAFPGLRVGVGF